MILTQLSLYFLKKITVLGGPLNLTSRIGVIYHTRIENAQLPSCFALLSLLYVALCLSPILMTHYILKIISSLGQIQCWTRFLPFQTDVKYHEVVGRHIL